MIIVYEPFCVGWNHVPVNSDFLLIISERFPNDEIVFIGEKEHIQHVKEKNDIQSDLINYKNIDVIEPSMGKIKSILNERKNIIQIAKEYKNKAALFFILNSHPHTMFFAKRYFDESIPIIFLLHGNLEELKRKKRFYQLGYWIKPAFLYKKKRKNMKFIVLGESIRNNVLKYIDFIKDDLIAVPHPYSMYEVKDGFKRNNNAKTVFGMIGSFSQAKRSELIFKLEERIRDLSIPNVEFLLVGADDQNGFPCNTNVRILGEGNRKLSDAEYNSGIEMLDYVLFFWPNDSYLMTASGAVHDAIAHRKPIISIRTPYLTWIFENIGQIGYLCNDFDELVRVVTQISKGEMKEDINAFLNNYDKAAAFFSKDNVSNIMNDYNVWMI